jgi:hypothetical protein
MNTAGLTLPIDFWSLPFPSLTPDRSLSFHWNKFVFVGFDDGNDCGNDVGAANCGPETQRTRNPNPTPFTANRQN